MNQSEKIAKVTALADLKEYSQGTIVQLPSFGEGQEFYAKLRRPSLLKLIEQGKIPNNLLVAAKKLFDGGATKVVNSADEQSMTQLLEVVRVVCEASFVEPTYHDLVGAGVELSDDQMLFVFGYSQIGVKQLENFRH